MTGSRILKLAAILLFVACFCVVYTNFVQVDSPISFRNVFNKTTDKMASVFFVDSVTEKSLKLAYSQATKRTWFTKNDKKLKILIVPGHDSDFPGTEYRDLKEVELNLDLGEKLYDLIKREPFVEAHITQTKDGYTKEFADYFEENRDSIVDFMQEKKNIMEHYVETGKVEQVVNVEHRYAPTEMAMKLYGINKWANENDIDIVIHVHFNDYPRTRRSEEGKYTGFSIYVPEGQYSNSKGSKSVAESVFNRLAQFYPQSNLPVEDQGIVEDQELIALGSNNTLNAASLLIEYGYIYEPSVYNKDSRNLVLEDEALQTYLGIMDFFGRETTVGGKYQTSFLPYQWKDDLSQSPETREDVLRLQAALVLDSVYPPAGEIKNDCTITGIFGPCTAEAVKEFQEKHNIDPAEGFVGEQTREKLNEIYSLSQNF